MCCVYLLISETHPRQHYIGLTGNLKKRLAEHNHLRSKHTSKFAPWNLAAYFAFARRETAVAFEQHLKSHSGKVFLKRHLLPRG